MAVGKAQFEIQAVQIKATGFVGIDAIIAEQKPLPEDHLFYSLVGRVAAEWARFEHILDQIIWDLAKGDEDVLSCITGQIMNYNARIKAIQALFKYRGYETETLKQINQLTKDIFSLAEERNRFVHDAWFIQEAGVFISEPGQFKSVSPGNKKFGFNVIKENEILGTINKIKQRAEMASSVRSLLSDKPRP